MESIVMKTYEEVIKFNASIAYSSYMCGSNNPFQYVGSSSIAFIFDKPINVVNDDITDAFDALIGAPK